VSSELARAGESVVDTKNLTSKPKTSKKKTKQRSKIPMRLYYETLVMKQAEPKVTGEVVQFYKYYSTIIATEPTGEDIQSSKVVTQQSGETQVRGILEAYNLTPKGLF